MCGVGAADRVRGFDGKRVVRPRVRRVGGVAREHGTRASRRQTRLGTPRAGWEDGTSSGDAGRRIGGVRASPWSESAAAIDWPPPPPPALGAPIPHDSRPSPLGADALFLLAELLDRTSGVVANWVTHQPRLWPGSRTATNLCVVASDAALVHDALTRAASVFERVAREEDDEDDDEAASAASGVQQSGLIDRARGHQSNDRVAPGSEVTLRLDLRAANASGARRRDRRRFERRRQITRRRVGVRAQGDVGR